MKRVLSALRLLPFLVCASLTLGVPLSAGAQTPVASADIRAEIEALARSAGMVEAFAEIERLAPAHLETLIELTEIPAPPFMEEARGARFAELLEAAGADSVWTDEVGNVIGLRRGRGVGRTVAMGGHLDTVFPEETDVTVRMSGDTLFAPGVGDDTRGLVVVLGVLQALEAAGIETESDLLFIGTVGEEGLGDLRGVKHLFEPAGPRIDSWIAIDGGSEGRIVSMGLGSVRYRVTFAGPGGHSWSAFGTANPAHALGRAIRYFQDEADTFTRRGPTTSYNVGRIGGGTSINSVPFEAWMEVDMRSESPGSLGQIEALLLEALDRAVEEENELRREGEPLEVIADKIGDRPSGEIDPSTPLVQRAVAAVSHFGEEPSLARSSTDSNVPIALGIPSVTLARGGISRNGHAPDEFWINRDPHLATQRALLVMVAEAGAAPPIGAP